jgi:hypothetical protein
MELRLPVAEVELPPVFGYDAERDEVDGLAVFIEFRVDKVFHVTSATPESSS